MNPFDTLRNSTSVSASGVGEGLKRTARIGILIWLGVGVIAVEPALAQSVGQSFCQSDLAETIRNVLTTVQFGGPLIGGTLFILAIIADLVTQDPEKKKRYKVMRNNGVLWGVIVAPLTTVILGFILSNIVVGGASCSF